MGEGQLFDNDKKCMILRRKEGRGRGGTCVMGKVPYREFLCEHVVKDNAPNISSLVRAIGSVRRVCTRQSKKICFDQG